MNTRHGANSRSTVRIGERVVQVGALLGIAFASWAIAAPQGEQVIQGDVQFQRNGATTVIHAGNNSIIHYSSFDIAGGETVQFVQPGASSRVLNRIQNSAPTNINGTLQANGIVYIINPAGVIFGQGAVVDTAGLIAAAANLSNADFTGGVDHFTGGSGAVVNYGRIAARTVSLIGRHVANHGSIVAENGMVTMVAGEDVLLAEEVGGHVMVKLSASDDSAESSAAAPAETPGVENTGTIEAPGGKVAMGAGDMFALAARHAGSIQAAEVTVDGQAGRTEVTGTIDATGPAGGKVKILGEKVALVGATIDASGSAGGGEVLIGGSVGGADPEVRNAERTYVGPESTLRADAIDVGDGGTVVVWADALTGFFGTATARGGQGGGDGGFIETSAKGLLFVEAPAVVDISAPAGSGGQWLLDPTNVTLSTAATSGMINGPDWVPDVVPPVTGNIQISAIVSVLETDGGAVTVSTAGGGGGTGTIDINDNIDVDLSTHAGATSSSLTLNALDTLTVGNRIRVYGSDNAGDQLTVNLNGSAAVDVNANIENTAGSGAIVLNTTGTTFDNTGGTINLAGGTVTINHTGAVTIPAAITGNSGVVITSSGADINGAGLVTSSTSVDLNADTGIGNTTAVQLATPLVTADCTTSGDIDIDNALATPVTLGSMATLAGGNLTFDQSGGGALSVTTATTAGAAAVTITNTAAISIGGAVTGNAGVVITSTGADINGAGLISSATSVDLNADTGIGNTAGMELATPVITADCATSGDIDVDNTLGAAVTLTSMTTLLGGNVTFDQSGGGSVTVTAVSTAGAGAVALTVTGGNMDLGHNVVTSGTGPVALSAAAVTATNASGTEEIQTGGSVSISGDSIGTNANRVEVRDATALTVIDTGAGDIFVNELNANTIANTAVVQQAVNIGAITIDYFGGSDAVNIADTAGSHDIAAGGVELDDVAHSFSFTGMGGPIIDSGTVTVNGAVAFITDVAGGAGITLDQAASTFGALTLRTLDGGAAAPGTISVLKNAAIALQTVETTGTASFTSTGAGADISDTGTGTLRVDGAATFITRLDGGGAVTLDNADSSFGALAVRSLDAAGAVVDNGAIAVVENAAMTLVTVDTTNTASFTSTGPTADISDTGAGTLSVGGAAMFITQRDGGGAITLDNGDSTFGDVTARSLDAAGAVVDAGAIAIAENAAMTLATVDTTGTASFTSTGAGADISDTGGGTLTVGDATAFVTQLDGGAAITLDNGDSTFGDLTVRSLNSAGAAVAGGAIAVAENAAMSLETVETTGTASFTSTGAGASITDTGTATLSMNGATFVTQLDAGGPITLDRPGATFGNLTVRSRNSAGAASAAGTITVVNDAALAIAQVETNGTASLQAGAGGAGGNLVINAAATLQADDLTLRAGDGPGGDATAVVTIGSAAGSILGVGGAGRPTTFTFRQDAAVTDATLPTADRFNGATPPTNYVVQADDGDLTVDAASARLAGSAVTARGDDAGGDTIIVTATGVTTVASMAVNGMGGADVITVDFTANDPIPAGGLNVDGGAGNDAITVDFTAVAALPAAGLTVVGGAGNDVITVDFTGVATPKPAGAISVDGGTQTGAPGDSLVITDGSATTATYTFVGTDADGRDGTVVLDGMTINFDGLEPLINTGTAADIIFALTAAADDVTLQNSAVAGQSEIVDNNVGAPTIEDTIFANPSSSLTINAGAQDDRIVFAAMDGGFAPALGIAVNGEGGNDAFVISAGLTLVAGSTVDGGVGTDTVDWSATTSRTVVLTGNAADGFTGTEASIPGGFSDIDALIGSAADVTDSLTGQDVVSAWAINAAPSYTDTVAARSVSFSNFETLNGGTDVDTFNVTAGTIDTMNGGAQNDVFNLDGGAVTTAINGEAGTDLFDFAAGFALGAGATVDGGSEADTIDWADQTARTVTLTGNGADGFAGTEASIPGGFSNIDVLIGSAADVTDSLTGQDVVSAWAINAAPSYTDTVAARSVSFSQFETLNGGADVDTFTVSAGGSIATLNGGAQNDVFNLDGGTVSAAVDGQAGDDLFDFAAGFALGAGATLDGGANTDTIDWADQASRTVVLTGNVADGFAGTEASIPGGFSNVDTLVGSAAGLTDTLTGMNTTATWAINAAPPSQYTDTGTGQVLGFSNFDNLTGDVGADTFTFGSGATLGGSIDGGGGAVNTLAQTDGVNAWLLDDVGNTVTGLGGTFTNIGILQGGTGDDTLTIDFAGATPIPAGGVTFNGGAQTAGDRIVLQLGAPALVAHTFTNDNDGAIDVTGSATINYTGLEAAGANPGITDSLAATDRTFTYGAGADAIDVTTGGGGAGDNGISRIDTTTASGVQVDFTNPTAGIVFNTGTAGGGDDTVTLNPDGPGAGVRFAGPMTVNAGDGLIFGAAGVTTGGSLTATGTTTLDVQGPINTRPLAPADSGAVILTAATGLTSAVGGTITTTGVVNTGTASGAVTLGTTGVGAVNMAGAISTAGASNNAGAGSSAGVVTITSWNGTISAPAVTATGGASNVAAGGPGAAVTIHSIAGHVPGEITATGTIDTSGGDTTAAGSGGGAAAPITINTWDPVGGGGADTGESILVMGNLLAVGGDGAGGGAAGAGAGIELHAGSEGTIVDPDAIPGNADDHFRPDHWIILGDGMGGGIPALTVNASQGAGAGAGLGGIVRFHFGDTVVPANLRDNGAGAAVVPSVATIVGNESAVNIAGRQFIMGPTAAGAPTHPDGDIEKFTGLGSVSIIVTDTARVGGITAGGALTVTAPTVEMLLRPGAGVLQFVGGASGLIQDTAVDFVGTTVNVAGARVDIPTATGGDLPALAAAVQPAVSTFFGGPGINVLALSALPALTGNDALLAPPTGAVWYTNGSAASGAFFTAFTSDLATSLASALPGQDVDVEIASGVEAAEREELVRHLGIFLKDKPTEEDVEAFLGGRWFFDDIPERAHVVTAGQWPLGTAASQSVNRVSIDRIPGALARRALARYRGLYWRQRTVEQPDGTTKQIWVARTRGIRDVLLKAFEAYSGPKGEQFDAKAFCQWVRSAPQQTAARDLLFRLSALFRDVELLGLGPVEQAISHRRLAGPVRPKGVGLQSFIDVVQTISPTPEELAAAEAAAADQPAPADAAPEKPSNKASGEKTEQPKG